MTFTIRLIDEEHQADINIKNEPFSIYGKLIPSYVNETWDYTTKLFEEDKKERLCFPDEHYSYDELKKEHFFIGAYDEEHCIGLAIFKHGFFKYMYLYDLKVNSDYRQQGIAKQLIEKGLSLALEQGYKGIFTQGQDNNLSACLFYLRCGFVIGGLDTKVYQGTIQENKKDIYFYLDA